MNGYKTQDESSMTKRVIGLFGHYRELLLIKKGGIYAVTRIKTISVLELRPL